MTGTQYSLLTRRKSRSSLRTNGERGFVRVNRVGREGQNHVLVLFASHLVPHNHSENAGHLVTCVIGIDPKTLTSHRGGHLGWASCKPRPDISLMTCPISHHGCSCWCWACWCAGWVGVTFSYINHYWAGLYWEAYMICHTQLRNVYLFWYRHHHVNIQHCGHHWVNARWHIPALAQRWCFTEHCAPVEIIQGQLENLREVWNICVKTDVGEENLGLTQTFLASAKTAWSSLARVKSSGPIILSSNIWVNCMSIVMIIHLCMWQGSRADFTGSFVCMTWRPQGPALRSAVHWKDRMRLGAIICIHTDLYSRIHDPCQSWEFSLVRSVFYDVVV